MTFKDSLLALTIIMVWGVNFVVIAIGLDGMPPLLMGGLRFLFVAGLGCWFVRFPKIPLRWIIAYAMTLSFAQFAFLFFAMSVGMPAGLASLVLQSQVLFTLIFALVLLKEQINFHQILAILVAGAGLTIIGLSSGETEMTAIGFVITLVAAACWAMGNLVTRTIPQKGYKANINLVIWSAMFSCVPFFIVSYFVEGPELMLESLSNISWQSIGSLLYLSLVATMVGYSLWSYLLSRYPAAQVAPLTLGVPVIGLASASLYLGEQLQPAQLWGIAIVMLGLLINMRLDRMVKNTLFKQRG